MIGKPFKKGFDTRRKIFSKEDRIKALQIVQSNRLEKYANLDFENLPINEKRRIILREQNGKCLCGISVWNKKQLTLELHHIDGTECEKRENLEILCPNCHSQTKNYRRKNKFNAA